MNIIQKIVAKIDYWQRRRSVTAFPYSVIKKYGEDEAGYQAALLTYYGFLSLFPLLLILTTVAGIIGGHNQAVQDAINRALAEYFPSFGEQLAKVQGLHKNGVALVIGILFTLYGARGVADAFRSGVNHIWQTPRNERPGFPATILNSLGLIGVGGTGFILASVISGYAANAGNGLLSHVLPIVINLFILFWMFRILLNIALPRRVPFGQTRSAAAAAAVGLVTLQTLGSVILGHQLKNLDAVYSIFALSLGLLFWIYLQAQTIYYAVEIASVRSLNLYPRGMQESDLTAADKRVYTRQVHREKQVDREKISTEFN